MLSKLTKSALIILTVALCCACIGSAFALYSSSATPIIISIYAQAPSAPDEIGLRGSWDSWAATRSMTYSAGTYSWTGDMASGTQFKGYNATASTYFEGNNYSIGKTGNYTVSYTQGDPQNVSSLSVSANNYTYTFSCPSWTSEENAVVFAWVWIGSGAGGWRALTTVSANVYTLTLDPQYDGCLLARMSQGTTIDNVDWSRQLYGNQTNDLDLSTTDVNTSSWH